MKPRRTADGFALGYTISMSPLLLRRLGLILVMLAFAFYVIFLAPAHDGPAAWRAAFASARNPAVSAIFGLLIVVTLLYWTQLYSDSLEQRIWAWPFALGMVAVGAFSLLAYLILRSPLSAPREKSTGRMFQLIKRRGYANLMLAAILGLLAWGVGEGDWLGFIREFRASGLVNMASVNLVLLILVFPVLLSDDFAHRGLTDESPLARIAMAVPLLGPALYLALRPDEVLAQPAKASSRRR